MDHDPHEDPRENRILTFGPVGVSNANVPDQRITMRAPLRLVSSFALAVLCATPARAIQSAADVARLDSLITREMKAQQIPGVAVAVVENGSMVLARAWGIANLESGTPLDTSSVFELASVTKQFTAAAIMLLVEQGKVGLDDPVSKCLERTPDTWAKITVRQLLTHTSGLPIDGLPDFEGSPLLRITSKQAFEFIAKQTLMFPPGEGAFYSDAGYFLLGLVIEKASGQSYRQFMQGIFDQAGLGSTSILDKGRVLKGRVATYELRNGELRNWRRDWDYEVPSFFGIFSTLGDLARWDSGLRRASILKRSSLDQMWTPAMLANGQPVRVFDQLYGLGWALTDVVGHRTVGHGGASGTYFLRFVDRPLTVILLSNRGVNGRNPMLLAESVAGILYPELRPPQLAPIAPDADAALTAKVTTLVADLVARRESAVTSAAYRAWYATAPAPWRAYVGGQLGRLGPPRHVMTVPLGGRSIWGAGPLDRLVYYTLPGPNSQARLTIGVTKGGEIGRVDFSPR